MDNSSDTIYGVLNGTREISDVIKKTQFENLDIIASNVDLSGLEVETADDLSLIHISEPTRQEAISYAVFCLKKKN